MLTTLRASAHDLAGLADKSVHMIATSPPYYGLRAYPGDQAIEWPAVTFRLNEWTEPLTIQGCEPGCAHEWVDGPREHKRGSVGASTLEGGPMAGGEGRIQSLTHGSYCVKCGGWRGPLGQEPDPPAYIGHLILCLREWRRVLRDDGTVFVNLGDTYAANRGYQVPDSKHVDVGNSAPARVPKGLKAKDLIGIPWLFAIAARADGWYLRDPIIWAKMLQDEDGATEGQCMPGSQRDRTTTAHEYIFMLAKSPTYYYDGEAIRAASGAWPRSVWQINPQPYKKGHYAAWPEKLVEQMIRAGSSEGGACPTCGAPWLRQTVTEKVPVARKAGKGKGNRSAVQTGGVETSSMVSGLIGRVTTTGWRASCACDAGDAVPCVVLDPFAGSGTTARVAIKTGREAIASDLSDEYLTEHVPARTTVQMEMRV